MADTKRNLDEFLSASTGLFKDNTAQDISAQDLRDFVLSTWVPYIRTISNANYSAVDGDLVVVTSIGSDLTMTLPASPASNARIAINYYSQTAGDKVIIARNGNKIAGVAADMNLYVADNTLGLHDHVVLQYDLTNTNWVVVEDGRVPHVAAMSRAAAQSIASVTTTKILFDTEIYDVGGIADPTTNNRFNILRAGKYQISAFWMASGIDDAEYAEVEILKTGVLQIAAYHYCSTANGFPSPTASIVADLAVGDTIEMSVTHNEGASLNTHTSLYFRPQMYVAELR